MEFKGNTGKRILTEDDYVLIVQKSFAFGSYEKKIPYARIKSIEIVKPSLGTAGYIRIIETTDTRIFDEAKKVQIAAMDEDSILFNGKKKYDTALNIKEVIENKTANSTIQADTPESIFTKRKKGGKPLVSKIRLFSKKCG